MSGNLRRESSAVNLWEAIGVLAMRIRQMSQMHWVAFFTLILLGWAVLFLMAVPADLRALEYIYGADLIAALCGGLVGTNSFAAALLMWTLMSAAMMAPTALPALATYDDLTSVDTKARIAPLVAGYLAIWVGFSAVAAALQVALFLSLIHI